MPLSTDDRQRLIARVGLIAIAINIGLTVARVLAGLEAGSTAVLADAVNSGTDILTTLVVIGGSRIASLPPDPGHPYGHEKAEPVAAKIVGLVVLLTGVLTAIGAISVLQAGGTEQVGLSAIWVTAVSIGVKEVLARYQLRTGRQINNQALLADGVNQRTDAFSSVAALIGALGGRYGAPALDPAMGIVVAVLILRVGLGVYWRSVNHLMDPAPEPAVMAELERAAASVPGVQSVDELKARLFGAWIYVDCKIAVDSDLTVAEGHRISARVKERVLKSGPGVRNVLVHVNPHETGQAVSLGPLTEEDPTLLR
jgi:cation diffusion facilitator family transporter